MSRIWDSLRRTEKANLNKTGSRLFAGQWGDLLAPLESWLESSELADRPSDLPRPAKRVGADALQETPEPLLRPEPVRTNKNSNGPAETGNQWQDLAQPPDSPPESIERPERLFCQLRPEEHVVSVGQNNGPGQEVFRVLCYRLQQIRQQRTLRRVLVTSAIPGEGKTVVAINIAAILARSSSRVLLVDADLRHSSMDHVLGLRSSGGLADILEDKMELEAACHQLDPLGIYYVPSGRSSKNPVELLQKLKLQEFMSQTESGFDWVVLDSPPLNLFADARQLAMLADAVLFVVREDVTPREALEQGLSALEGAYVAGIVLNASTSSARDHYYDAYKSVPANGRGQFVPGSALRRMPRDP